LNNKNTIIKIKICYQGSDSTDEAMASAPTTQTLVPWRWPVFIAVLPLGHEASSRDGARGGSKHDG